MRPATPTLAHLAILVRDLGAQTAVPLEALGLRVRDRTAVPGEGAAVWFIPVGHADVELVQPLAAGGPLARFLEGRGEAIHHIALRVADLDGAIRTAAGAGLRVAGRGPRAGAHGTRVAFIHPSSLDGVLIEFVESR